LWHDSWKTGRMSGKEIAFTRYVETHLEPWKNPSSRIELRSSNSELVIDWTSCGLQIERKHWMERCVCNLTQWKYLQADMIARDNAIQHSTSRSFILVTLTLRVASSTVEATVRGLESFTWRRRQLWLVLPVQVYSSAWTTVSVSARCGSDGRLAVPCCLVRRAPVQLLSAVHLAGLVSVSEHMEHRSVSVISFIS
jgi:hypothetical protein